MSNRVWRVRCCGGRRGQGRGAGFTLVELLIALVVAGILLAVAVPMYREQVRKSRRADAQALLLEATQFMERNLTNCRTYAKMPAGGNCNTDAALPASLQFAPKEGATKFYTLSISAASASAFTLSAVPLGDQANDSCGSMTINNLGVKTAAAGNCWR